ncbi:hypothetical protein D9611_013027 [Ephemerocybe angulata]|uniref:Protein-S-isoprenylcysteine O-methyltransferase n=1 Tax=Ephemerocybe angulata TaxID=980116 RepID=A0A8H5AUM0_9AGAR|nr:hypothetical protein D9611_013027 [Tulosesus angulatus]
MHLFDLSIYRQSHAASNLAKSIPAAASISENLARRNVFRYRSAQATIHRLRRFLDVPLWDASKQASTTEGPHHTRLEREISEVAFMARSLFASESTSSESSKGADSDLRQTTYWIAGIIEAALLLASMHPSHPLSRFLISTFVWSTPGSISRLRITPTFILGNVLTFTGCMLRLSCYKSLGTFFSFELSLYNDHKLIDTGPYSVVRHPSYTGLTLGIIGAYLNQIQGSWVSECGVASYSNAPGLGSMIVALWVVFSLAVIISLFLRMPNEDKMLKARFGDEWVVWSTKVPYRLLPGVY